MNGFCVGQSAAEEDLPANLCSRGKYEPDWVFILSDICRDEQNIANDLVSGTLRLQMGVFFLVTRGHVCSQLACY